MIIKEGPAKGGNTRVTFELSDAKAHQVQLAGDFNGWADRIPMEQADDGRWRVSLELDPDREYEFRYVVDESTWVNDPEAEAFAPNTFGTVNCVVRT